MLLKKTKYMDILKIILIFILLNIFLNLNSFFYNYFDQKIELKDTAKTLFITDDTLKLSVQELNIIKEIKHVEDIKITTIEASKINKQEDLYLYDIIVDNWKNCKYVQNILTNNGFETKFKFFNEQFNTIINSYFYIEKITYLIIFIAISITFLINSLYCKKQISKSSTKLSFIFKSFIIVIISYILSCFIILLLQKLLNFNFDFINFKNIIINLIVSFIPIIFNLSQN